MKHIKGIVTALLIAVVATGGVLLLAFLSRGDTSSSGYQSPTMYAMDTTLDVTINGRSGDQAKQDAMACNDYVKRLEAATSRFKAGSEVAMINQNAGVAPVKVGPDTLAMIERSLEFSRLSDGAYDITIAPVEKLWGFYDQKYRVPSQQEIDSLLPLVDYRKVTVDHNAGTVMLADKGMEIDLGSVAKGYAVGSMCQMLRQRGVQSGLVNFGGSVGTIGKRPDGKAWVVGVKNPRGNESDLLGKVNITNAFVDSSGDYERFFIVDGKRYCHILDPRTGRQPDSTMDVTTIGPHPMDQDILNTALFVTGKENGAALMQQFPECSNLFVDSAGNVSSTGGFDRYVLDMKQHV